MAIQLSFEQEPAIQRRHAIALTELKEDEPWLRLYHSKMLQMIPHKINSARRSLKEKKKLGYDVGQLQYATRNKWNTFIYNQSGFRIEKHGNVDLVWLSKIGCG